VQIEAGVDPDGQVYVRVRDYGIGIRKDHQSDIFSKFYRVEESADRFQGLGIGLYICAEDHPGVMTGNMAWKVSRVRALHFIFTVPIQPVQSLNQ